MKKHLKLAFIISSLFSMSSYASAQTGGVIKINNQYNVVQPMTTGYWTEWKRLGCVIYNYVAVTTYERVYYQLNPGTGEYVELRRERKETRQLMTPNTSCY